jgi:CelD/BcsL family acetyltransferase involved in cellulose biosynthesis
VTVRRLRGPAAIARVDDPSFVAQWNSLWQACPWATSLQLPAFVRLWYRIYRERFEPVLVEETAPDGALTGLMTLAIPAGTRQLVGAGAEQAEYQGWLSDTADGDTFFLRGLAALQAGFPGFTLSFPNLTPGAPLGWHQSSRHWQRATELRSDVRGLMPLGDGASLDRSLRKKSNRSRLNRLERIGPVRLEQITSRAALEKAIDEIAALYDLRQGALNGITPFHSDPLKRQFHLELLAEGLLHATVLRVGDAIVSAHLNLHNRDQVLLCVIAHAPQVARHSPGKLHILLLGKQLAQEGVSAFDLSPGGEYKERFATTHEPVYAVRVYLGATPLAIARIRQGARRLLAAAGIQTRQVRTFWAGLGSLITGRGLRQGMRRLARSIGGQNVERTVLTYRLSRPPEPTDPIPEVSRDRIADVVHCLTAAPPYGHEPQEMLRQALDRLEEGDHIFTQRGPQALLASGWLAHRGSPVKLGGFDLEFTAPAPGPVLYDLERTRGTDSPDPRAILVKAVLATACREAPGEPVIALVPRGDVSLARLLEALGFAFEPSLKSGLRQAAGARDQDKVDSDESHGDRAGTSAPDKL